MSEIENVEEIVEAVDAAIAAANPAERPPAAPLEFRAAELLDVRWPDRTIELLAVPYETETDNVLVAGRQIVEVFSRGAFDGVERRAGRVKVNRDHDVAKTVGRATALHPSRSNGLVAELRISKTPLGDESLELAADGVLDSSVGFAPMPNGEVWTNRRQHRRIEKAFLGHISLVPDPAFDSAQVLSVRRAGSDEPTPILVVSTLTPNKDLTLARLAEIGYHPSIK